MQQQQQQQQQRASQRNTNMSAYSVSNYNDMDTSNVRSDNDDDDEENDIATENQTCKRILKLWGPGDKSSVSKVLYNEMRNIDCSEIQKRISKECICLYRFSEYFGGAKCKGTVINGICALHWNNMGIHIIDTSGRVIENPDEGSSIVFRDVPKPIFNNVHRKGQHSICPIVRSIPKLTTANKDTIFNYMVKSYEYIAPKQKEAEAMAKALFYMVFGEKSFIIIARERWESNQKNLIRLIDPKNVYNVIVQHNKQSKMPSDINTTSSIINITIDDLSIFDTPFILTIPTASVMCNKINGSGNHNNYTIANPANISMFHLSAENIATFAIAGPICYAPYLEVKQKTTSNIASSSVHNKSSSSLLSSDKVHGSLKYSSCNINTETTKQHCVVYALLGGISTYPKKTIIQQKLADNDTLVIQYGSEFLNKNTDCNIEWDAFINVDPNVFISTTSSNNKKRVRLSSDNLSNIDDFDMNRSLFDNHISSTSGGGGSGGNDADKNTKDIEKLINM